MISFGWSLAVANFGTIAHDDLLVGVPGEDVGDVKDAGADQVLYGSADGLTLVRQRGGPRTAAGGEEKGRCLDSNWREDLHRLNRSQSWLPTIVTQAGSAMTAHISTCLKSYLTGV
jgi:hypothetical protein